MGDMDSGNSASIQSSSSAGGGAGDDQEFESHGGGDGGVLFNQSSLASFDNTGSFQLYSLNNGSSTYNNFDPLTNNFDTNFMINQNHNSDRTNNNDLGLLWPSTISSPLDNTNGKCTTTTTVGPATGFSPNNNNNNPLSGIGPRPLSIPSSGAPLVSDHPGPGGAVRNPKKRSRASRRAPTTVLTTDTNNFRQMVQEFTGIPAPPFSGRTRLDLLGGTVSSPGVDHQTPPYVLRPFPQKIVHSNHLSINNSLNPQSCINNNTSNNQSVRTLQSLLRPSPSSTFENLYRSGINTGLGCNAAGFLINQFALGQVTTTATPTTNVITTTLNQNRLPLRRPVDDGGSSSRNAGTSLENQGGITRSEGMVDSWICSSDESPHPFTLI